MNHFSDENLVKECLKGKASAEHALYNRFGNLTFGICRRYASDQMEAEDLHQIGWIKAFDKLKRWSNEGPLGAWLRKLFVNVCLTAYQKKKKQLTWLQFGVENEAVSIVEDSRITSDFLELEVLTNLVSKLPEGARLVFNLFAVEGMNHREIAETLSITEETSRQQLRRARLQLTRQLLENHKAQPMKSATIIDQHSK